RPLGVPRPASIFSSARRSVRIRLMKSRCCSPPACALISVMPMGACPPDPGLYCNRPQGFRWGTSGTVPGLQREENHRMPKAVVLLGPQRFEPTLASVVHALGIEEDLATVTAGWQEREDED